MKLKSNGAKIAATIIADIIVFAILILTFAWFHHAKPGKFGPGTELPTLPPVSSPEPVAEPTDEPDVTPCPDASEEPVVTQSAEPTGLLGGKYADKH